MAIYSADRRGIRKRIILKYAEHSDVTNATSAASYNGVNAIVTSSLLLNVHTI